MKTPYHSLDLALEETGTMLVLAGRGPGSPGYTLTRCTKYGDPLEALNVMDAPAEFDDFTPDSMMCANRRIYLVDRRGMKAVVIESDGRFSAGYFITADGPGDLHESSIESFRIDDAGALSFTLSCKSEPFVVTIGGEDDRPTFNCYGNRGADRLTLGVITFIGLFVSCYLIK